jgi:hypothetical protein
MSTTSVGIADARDGDGARRATVIEAIRDQWVIVVALALAAALVVWLVATRR